MNLTCYKVDKNLYSTDYFNLDIWCSYFREKNLMNI